MPHGFQEWGGKGLEANQCVVEVCWEEEFATSDGTSKVPRWEIAGAEEGAK